uniref:Secreted protein n=1 Tax=Mesocestoides corti TaxID=53468 RepID=A0A5K3FT09_MESCO
MLTLLLTLLLPPTHPPYHSPPALFAFEPVDHIRIHTSLGLRAYVRACEKRHQHPTLVDLRPRFDVFFPAHISSSSETRTRRGGHLCVPICLPTLNPPPPPSDFRHTQLPPGHSTHASFPRQFLSISPLNAINIVV